MNESEIQFLLEHPDALRLLADFNDVQATLADGMGMADCVRYHESRASLMRTLAAHRSAIIEDET